MPTRLYVTLPSGPALIDVPAMTLVLTPAMQFVEPQYAHYVLATSVPITSLYTPFSVDQIASAIVTASTSSYSVNSYETVDTVQNPDPNLIVAAEPAAIVPALITCLGTQLTFVPVTVESQSN